MNLPFEQITTRRHFLIKCSMLALGSSLLPKIVKFGHAQDVRRGYINKTKARYYESLPNKKVKCLLCPHGCIVKPGSRGFCRVRENDEGIYYTQVHSNPCAVHIDPIEKKPLFHFLPGTTALSIATAGCNFTCKNCQNYTISQANPEDTHNYQLRPEDIVDLAIHYKTPTIAYTYTEPTVFFEYMLETSRIAHGKNIRNVYHSNGYMNQDPLLELADYLDGANIDLKAYSNAFYQEIASGTLLPVLETLKTLKKRGVWLEITNLVIPTKNDEESMLRDLCQWIVQELGKDTPVHFSRFYPCYKLNNLPPTPVKTLEKAAEIGRTSGLDFVYIGNVPNVEEENTFCPRCRGVIIGRKGYSITDFNMKNGVCTFCRTAIPGRWE
jgi:pyruvate formate lyase activating enzyme